MQVQDAPPSAQPCAPVDPSPEPPPPPLGDEPPLSRMDPLLRVEVCGTRSRGRPVGLRRGCARSDRGGGGGERRRADEQAGSRSEVHDVPDDGTRFARGQAKATGDASRSREGHLALFSRRGSFHG